MNRNWVTLLATVVCALPASVVALGLGEIEVRSSLNEPLRAVIPLQAVQEGDIESMRAGLGSVQQFERAGVERPFVLSGLRFIVVDTGGDAPAITIDTADPVVEPFLNFLVEVNWTRGRVIREYTILLDPPVYGDAISSTVRESMTVVQSSPVPAPAQAPAQAPAPAPVAETAPAPAPAASMRAPAPAPASAPGGAMMAAPAGTYGPVNETDTLWSIAERFRPDPSVSVQRMMLAILEANPTAFSIENVNALRAGAVLRIPTRDEIGAEDRAETLREVKRQYAAWDDYRGSVAGAAAPAVQAPPPAQPAGEAAPGAPAQEPVTRLEVVAGGTASDTGGAPSESVGADLATLRDDLRLATEEAEAARMQTDELSSRLTEAEQLITDLQRLVELKDDSIAALQQQIAEDEAAAPAEPAAVAEPEPRPVEAGTEMPASTGTEAPESTESQAAAGMEPQPTTQAPAAAEPESAAPPEPEPEARTPRPAPPPPAPPPSLLDSLRASLPFDPLIGIGIGGLLVLGGGLALLRRRRRAAAESVDEEDEGGAPVVVSEGGSMIEAYAGVDEDTTELPEDATVVPAGTAPDEAGSEDITEISDSAVDTVGNEKPEYVTEEDPLAEVNVYLAYERYEQAEELVRSAIDKYPGRHQYRTRLLEVLFAAGGVAAFQAAAREMRDVVGEDSPDVQGAQAMWSELSPGTDLFGAEVADAGAGDDVFDVTGADDGSGTVDSSVGEVGGGTGLDFDLGFDGGSDEATEMPVAAEPGGSSLDFDLGFATEAEAGDGTPEAGDPGALDFDLGSVEPETGEAPGGALDFEIGEETPSAGEADSALDFDLDSLEAAPGSSDADRTPLPERIAEGDGLDFDLGSFGETVADASSDPAAESEPATEQSSGLDLDFDLDAGAVPSADEAEPAGDEAAGGASGLDLDFDLGGEAEEAPDADAIAGDGTGLDLDFDLGDEAEEAPAADVIAGDGTGLDLDFDLGGEAGEAAAASEASGLDLDFDLDSGAGPREAPSVEADEGDGLELDFDLGADASDGEAEVPAAAADEGDGLELDFDLGADASDGEAETPAAAADEGDGLEIDFDLGGDASDGEDEAPAATADEGSDLELDFGLGGDTGAGEAEAPETADEGSGLDLDFDLGSDTDAGDKAATPDEGSGLDVDFDLGGDTGGDDAEAPAADEGGGLDLGLGDASGEETASVLDFDLGAGTGDEAGGEPAGTLDSGLDLDLGGGDATFGEQAGTDDGDEASALDFDVGSADDIGFDVGEASGTGESGLDLDLGGSFETTGEGGDLGIDLELPSGDEGAAGSAGLDLDLGAGTDAGAPEPAAEGEKPSLMDGMGFETVQIRPDQTPSLADGEPDLSLDAGDGGETDFGIDTEFRGIFDADTSGGDDSMPSLDVDLGGEGAEGATGGGVEDDGDFETTQFMLRDVPTPQPAEPGDEDDGHTLVLGRGLSGEIDEIQTKLDLAQAYIDMDDRESARGVLGEVLAEGNEQQQDAAKELLARL